MFINSSFQILIWARSWAQAVYVICLLVYFYKRVFIVWNGVQGFSPELVAQCRLEGAGKIKNSKGTCQIPGTRSEVHILLFAHVCLRYS